jgi:hypothetical protein
MGAEARRAFHVSVPVLLSVPLLALLAASVRAVIGINATSIAAFVVLFAGALALLVALTWRSTPRAGACAAAGGLALTAVTFCAPSSSLREVLVEGTGLRCGCGNGLMGALLLGGPVVVGGLLALSLSLSYLGLSRRGDSLLRWTSIGSVALALVALAFGAARAGRPEPARYVESLPIVSELTEGDRATVAGHELRYVGEATPPPSEVRECRLEGVEGVSPWYAESPGSGGPRCSGVRLRFDAVSDVAVVETRYGDDNDGEEEWRWSQRGAFWASSGEAVEVRIVDVAASVAPPRGWLAAAAVGALAGAAFLLAARRARRRMTLQRGTDARHEGDGWVVLPDERRVHAAQVASLPLGPVVVFLGNEPVATYRAPGAPTIERAAPGSMALRERSAADLVASLEAAATSVALLGTMPLVAARLAGIL